MISQRRYASLVLTRAHSSSSCQPLWRWYSSTSNSPCPHIPVITSLAQLRSWRRRARDRSRDVAVVPTMGALHQGHLDLVRHALSRHDLTIMTLFVNPMQFAPTEDLTRYPRTLQRDLDLLRPLVRQSQHRPGSTIPEANRAINEPNNCDARDNIEDMAHLADKSANDIDHARLVVFNPSVEEMYPLRGDLQDMGKHQGLRVQMRGIGNVLEGHSRPQFFTGVATVCTKLFNAVEPDHAYFGQKDIQQALLLRLMVTDLLLSHPSPDRLHIVRTTRDPETSLALSSRNVYLSPEELSVAPVLYQALIAAKALWEKKKPDVTAEDIAQRAKAIITSKIDELQAGGSAVSVRIDYVEVFDRDKIVPMSGLVEASRPLVLAGAIFVGQTRLLDNVLLGWDVE